MEEMSPVICPALAGMIRLEIWTSHVSEHVPCTRGDPWFGTGRSRSVPNRLFGHAAVHRATVHRTTAWMAACVIRHPLFVIKPRYIKPRYISPCAVIAVATLRKPAALAPSIRSPASP